MVAIGLAGSAYAQSHPVYQTGMPTRGHLTQWSNNGQIQDAGGALNGHLQSIGIVPAPLGPLPPFCINDAPTSNPGGYNQLCVSAADVFGDGGQLTYSPIAGAVNNPFTVQSGNVLALNSNIQQIDFQNLPATVSGDVPVCINPATGQLFQAPSTTQTILLMDDTETYLLMDDTETYILTASLPAGKCVQQ